MEKTHAGSQQTGPGFDDRIVLSADKLYERFGRENGADILAPYFSRIFWESYKDSLLVPDAEPLISYILSCHEIRISIFWTNTKISGDLYRERQRMGSLLPRMPAFFVKNNQNLTFFVKST